VPNADRSSAWLLSSLAISDVAAFRSAAVSESRATLWSAMNGGSETRIERSIRSSRVPVRNAVISGHAVATPVRLAS
jgi:hypothetical protein